MFKPKVEAQAQNVDVLARDTIRRALWEALGFLLIGIAFVAIRLRYVGFSIEAIFDSIYWGIVLECVIVGLSFLFKEPALERIAKFSIVVFVKTWGKIIRIEMPKVNFGRSSEMDRAAQKAFAAVFTRGESPTRDHLYGELKYFDSPAQWDDWRKRCVEKQILSVGGRGGGLISIKGIDAEEAWRRWSAPSGKWRTNAKGKLVEQ